MIVYLIRHGKTAANERRLYCGSSDEPLSAEGRAKLLAMRQRNVYPDVEGMKIITSGMKRTNETLEILYGSAPDRCESGFREMDFGDFEMRSYAELKTDPAYQAWIMDQSGDYVLPGGESVNVFERRVIGAFENIKEDSLIVCHGGVIVAIMQHLFPEEEKNIYQWQSENGRGYRIVLDGKNRTYRSIP